MVIPNLNSTAIKALIIVVAAVAAVFLIKAGFNSYTTSIRNAGIEEGIKRENAVWVDREKKRVEDQEKKIKEVETSAKTKADALAAERDKANSQIEELNKQLDKEKRRVNTVIYTKDNKPVTCNSQNQETEIYLGTEFSNRWNAYNKVMK